jgi:hypothetical protein
MSGSLRNEAKGTRTPELGADEGSTVRKRKRKRNGSDKGFKM